MTEQDTISAEYEYLLHLLRSAVHGTVPENIPDEASWEKVLAYATTHEVANIAFLAVKKLKNPPEETIFQLWYEQYLRAVKRDVLQQKARKEILEALHSQGIYTLELQGTVVKRYYPQSHMRMMSDLDFIIPIEKLHEGEETLRSLGFETKVVERIEIHGSKGGIIVELHTEFFGRDSITKTVLQHPYDYAVCGENYTAAVDDTVFYLFHLLHTIKHCGLLGSGLRRILDLYYLETAMEDKVDHGYIDGVLKEYGFYETKQQLLAVKDHWFNGITPEIDVTELEPDILESGNHGMRQHYYRNVLSRERAAGKHFVKLRFLLEFFFPSKEALYCAHPAFERNHLPLLVCWIARAALVVYPSRRERMKKVVRNVRKN